MNASTPSTDDPRELATTAATELLRLSGVERIDLALTLGSGWGKAADVIGETVALIPAGQVPGFHVSSVPGHSGTLRVIALPNGGHALIIGARTHLYEGRGVRAVVHGVRTAAAAGAQTLILTNGAGGLDPAFNAGDAMIISDHLNLTALSPIEGANFVDLTDLYSSRLREVTRGIDPTLREGVYVQMPGPHYETPAESRYLHTIGGHAVGMSTALEAIAAREAGMEVLGLTLVTNPATNLGTEPLTHQEVIDAGKAAEPKLAALLQRIVAAL
ncbi:purine-nucleoside phosphorylase [Leucobacter sp. GX24907]